MSESLSEADSLPSEDGPLFAYQKYYNSAGDKDEIDDLPEIKREEILAERAAQIERHEQDIILRRMVARTAAKKQQDEKKKRKASAADLEENQRKSSRQRTKLGGGRVGEADDAIEAYKRARTEKASRDEQRRKDAISRREREAARSPNDDDFSDADAEGESEVEWDNSRYRKRTPTPPKDDPPADLEDVQRARIGRDNFAQVCYTPGFEQAATNCYARVCIGPNRTTGQNEYRLCLIRGFTKGRPYAMVGTNGRPFPVETYLLAAHGKAEKQWTFLECSMSKFTDDEWRRYRVVMANDEKKLPTKGMIARKLTDINTLISHRFNEAEISEKMHKQDGLLRRINKVEEKTELEERKNRALEADDYDEVEAINEKLAAITPMKLAHGTSLMKTTTVHINREQERLAELNKRNEKINAENVRKAQLAEMKKRPTKKPVGNGLLVPTASGLDDLFDGSDISRSGTPVNGSRSFNGTPRAGTPVSLLKAATKDKKGIPTIRKAALDDEILANMDLGIEIEI